MDLLQYIKSLGSEKYRSIIIHASPDKSAVLSGFAHDLSRASDGELLDLLNYFYDHADLASEIDQFTPEKLKNLLIEKSSSIDLLIVDRMDFLLDTWRKEEHRAFYRMIKHQWNSFLEDYRATLVFCLQTSTEIRNLTITDTHGNTRVLSLSELNDLP